jgi:enediyne biosynthesis protein E3
MEPAMAISAGDLSGRAARKSGFGLGGWRSLLRIDPSQASFATRGFPTCNLASRRRLEKIGEIFLAGFNRGVTEEDTKALRCWIESFDIDHRGFAVEGCAMGFAVADAFSLRPSRLNEWLARTEPDYAYLALVGAGWALARVPWRRAAILRECDPVHGWLIFDGLGFHDAYFSSQRVLRNWRRLRRGYAARVYDQGVGRALWFIHGGAIERAIFAISRFPPDRHGDLWSGLGLALAYAGAAAPSALSLAVANSGAFRAHLAQGAAFAAEAHARARHIPVHTHDAVAILTGCDAWSAVELVREHRARLPRTDELSEVPRYELWRRAVQCALL